MQVEIGDNSKYVVKGVGTSSVQLDSRDSLHMKDVLLVPGLKKNLLPISYLEDRGYRVAFVDGQVLVWLKHSSIDSTGLIVIQEGGLYSVIGCPTQALIYDSITLCELWHQIFSHLHYMAFPTLSNIL